MLEAGSDKHECCVMYGSLRLIWLASSPGVLIFPIGIKRLNKKDMLI
jgi:hypothetical protein